MDFYHFCTEKHKRVRHEIFFIKKLTICTGVACAPVYFLFTVRPCEAKRANTSVAGPLFFFQACAAVKARRIYTRQSAVLTVSAVVARGAQAVITVLHILQNTTLEHCYLMPPNDSCLHPSFWSAVSAVLSLLIHTLMWQKQYLGSK